MKSRRALFPGSFDPPTNGHLDIIKRMSSLYETAYVVVADNIHKKSLFTVAERISMLKELCAPFENVVVDSCDSLVARYAEKRDIGVMIRGVRGPGDFSYEFELALYNKQINPALEILFMPCDPSYFMVRSSAVREMVQFNADISKWVPPLVDRMIKEKK